MSSASSTGLPPSYACASASTSGMQYPNHPYYMSPMGHYSPMGHCYDPSSFYHYPYGYNQPYFPPPPSRISPDLHEPARASTAALEQSIESDQEPFFIQFLNGRIKICYGCKGSYLRGGDGTLLSAPNDVCIAHKEPRHFVNPRTGSSNSKNSNAYYHVNRSCIMKNYPHFTNDDIQCTAEIKAMLEPSHLQLIEETLGYLV